MANNMKYFIGNWKMFGVPKSINIIDKINKFVKSNKKFNKKYKVIITPPHTLVQSYSKYFLNTLLHQQIDITSLKSRQIGHNNTNKDNVHCHSINKQKEFSNYRVGLAKKIQSNRKEIIINKRGVFQENMEISGSEFLQINMS